MMITFNGRSIGADGLGDALMREALGAIEKALRAKITAIREPTTGEFPTVVATTSVSPPSLRLTVEGSPGLLELVQSRLTDEEKGLVDLVQRGVDGGKTPPTAFLSYTSDDRDFASAIAHALQANGIETFWAEWEIRAGESIRQRIDEGIGNCTHFLVLLTPRSIGKPWVNAELDAGFVRRLGGRCRLIPLRSGVAVTDLSPLLQGLVAPEIDPSLSSFAQVIADIHGLSSKPPLGAAPDAASAVATGYSSAATAIARLFVEESKQGLWGDPRHSHQELRDLLSLTKNDEVDGVHELVGAGCLADHHYFVVPTGRLFGVFDRFWKPWNPETDALRLAADLVNDPAFPRSPRVIAERYAWAPRRLNPALSYLKDRDVVQVSDTLDAEFATHRIMATDATRRFVASRC